MDVNNKDKFEMEKNNDNPLNFPTPSMSSDWRFSGANITNAAMLLVPTDNSMPVSSSSCSPVSMVDSYAPATWDQSANLQSLGGFCDINVQSIASTSSTIDLRRPGPASLKNSIDRPLDMGWNPPASMLKGGLFLPNAPGMLPQSLAQFPADSAFIERAARFSCFNGGNFSDMVNPFGIPEPLGFYPRMAGMMEGPPEVFAGSGLKSVSGSQLQKIESNVEAPKDVSLSVEHRASEASPLKNERRSESLGRSIDELKQGVGGSGNESDEAEFSGSGGHEEPSVLEGTGGELSGKSCGSKKRKRNEQDVVLNQAKTDQQNKGNSDNQQKGDQTQPSSAKNVGKNGKQGSQASDPQKEEYIHVRARRGQATNSHSLAERVRREKISERMKFLQDLVPGCSKVTGKAVMLDEIINYVQSLQRQVEFLSMKLATVNPRLDFNIEGLHEKNILQSRAGSSSNMGILPDMPMAYPPLHPSQHGLIPSALPGLGNPSDVLRHSINRQLMPMTGGFKEPNQIPGAWDDQLHNVVQMNYGTSVPPDNQDANVSLPAAHMKDEP